jgi:predicted  nucleic acid-binding Zn-ribbon protein
MEKLDLLTQRVDSLIQEMVRLREANASLGSEITELKDELELGRMEKEDLQKQIISNETARNEACTRIDALIGRIQAVLSDTHSGPESQQAPLPSPAGQE